MKFHTLSLQHSIQSSSQKVHIILLRKGMLDSELKFYLKTHLQKPTIDFKWSDEDNTNLFAYFNKTCAKECLLDAQNQLRIKQAFKEYFEPVGYILFKMNENQITS